MYRCAMCGQSSKPGESINREVIQSRYREYRSRDYKRKAREIHDPGGAGRETVKEVALCFGCAVKVRLGETPFEQYKPEPLRPVKRRPRPAPAPSDPVSPEQIKTLRIDPRV